MCLSQKLDKIKFECVFSFLANWPRDIVTSFSSKNMLEPIIKMKNLPKNSKIEINFFSLFENTFLEFSEFYQISHERKPNKNFTEERRKTMAMTATFQTNIFNFEFQFDKCFDRFNTFCYIRSESPLTIEYFIIFVLNQL